MDVFLFPGRSSRYPEMIGRMVEAWPVAAELVSFASRILGRDLHRQYQSDNHRIFASEADIQVGVFLASHLHLRALEANDVHAEMSLGLGLGEYNHLVHIGALDFEEALKLVDARGRAFELAPRGSMVRVTHVSTEIVNEALAEGRVHGTAESGIHLSPEHHVIAGEAAAVDATLEALRSQSKTVRHTHLDVDTPAYSSLMAPSGHAMRPALTKAKWKLASHLYMPNVLASPVLAYAPETFVDLLSRQVYSPVRWRESIEFLARRDPSAVFVEVGPTSTCFELLPQNWITNRQVRTDRPGDLAASFVAAAREIADAE